MQKHILIHTGEKPHKCVCGMSFSRKDYLAVHIEYQQKKVVKGGMKMVHREVIPTKKEIFVMEREHYDKQTENPFVCRICLKTFTRKNNLKQHMAGHSDSRPFECTECDRRFAKKANLKSHMLTHSGEKPHLCPTCNIGFSRKSNLTKHILIHQRKKQFLCTECGRDFTQKKNLAIHYEIHSKPSLYQCSKCERRFSRRDSLIRHLNRYAGSENKSEEMSDYFLQEGICRLFQEDHQLVDAKWEEEKCHKHSNSEQKKELYSSESYFETEKETDMVSLPKLPAVMNDVKQVTIFLENYNDQ